MRYLIIIGLILLSFIFGVQLGREQRQGLIEARALALPTDALYPYTWKDIEYVVHGESQE